MAAVALNAASDTADTIVMMTSSRSLTRVATFVALAGLLTALPLTGAQAASHKHHHHHHATHKPTPSTQNKPKPKPKPKPPAAEPPTTKPAAPTPSPTTNPIVVHTPVPVPAGKTTPKPSPSTPATPSPAIPPASPGWVSTCGLSLCLDGSAFQFYMGSINGHSDPADATKRAVALGLNTLRLTDFLNKTGALATAPYDATRWAAVDKVIAASKVAGLHVELDLATYRNMLVLSGKNPYTYDWSKFISFVANRHNTVNGLRYGDDPTIALVAFAGEVEPLSNASNTMHITSAQLVAFYRTALAEWASLAPHQLLTSGGLLQLGWNSGIDWKAIFALPHNDVPSIHVYSDSDRDKVVPAVAAYTESIGKPWITEEFGFEASLGDANRAADFDATYALNRQYGSAGVGFWNIGPQTTNTHDVGPQFPLTFAAVHDNRP